MCSETLPLYEAYTSSVPVGHLTVSHRSVSTVYKLVVMMIKCVQKAERFQMRQFL